LSDLRPDPRPFPKTLPEALHRAAIAFPDKGLAIFDGRGRSHERRSWAEVRGMACTGAERLAALGVERGDRVVVCLPSSWEWMESWLGALLLGAWPVALAPAGALGSSEAHTRRVAEVVERLDARLLVTGASVLDEAARLAESTEPGSSGEGAPGEGSGREALRELAARGQTPERLAEITLRTVKFARPEPEEVAFLQLTSGSTGVPRAVQITHAAAMHNNRVSDEAIGAPHGAPAHTWADAMVAWLPLNHDMGLVGCLFMSLTHGLDLWLMNPTTFLARPGLWLEQIARRGVTFAPAPNFGYQLLAERLGGAMGRRGLPEGLDLSGFRAALVGAEMVRPETVEAFVGLTEPHGFDPRAIRPCYGLAEGTLAVTFDCRGEGLRTRPRPAGTVSAEDLGGREVACVGAPVADTEVRILAPDGRELPEGEIGEVRARGPGIFTGYYNDSKATAEALVDGWLATGDLGFLHGGELYLTGRLKDILILRGHNLMPHELEWLAEGVTGGGGVERAGAFSVDGGPEGERPVLVVETGVRAPDALRELAHDIRREVGRTLSLILADVTFVRRGKIPKTTSGKVQRRELKRRYLAGDLERLDTVPET